MLYECVTQECPEMLPTYIAIEQVTQKCINWFPECNLDKHKTLLNVYCVHDTCCVAQAVRAVSRGDLLQTFPLWQLRLVVELWDSRVMHGPAKRHDALLTSEFLPVMKNMVDAALDTWLKGEKGQKMDAIWFQTTCVHFLTSSEVTWMCFLNCFPVQHSHVRTGCVLHTEQSHLIKDLCSHTIKVIHVFGGVANRWSIVVGHDCNHKNKSKV